MADMEDDVRRARQDYDAAMYSVKQAVPGKPGFGIESRYGEAYQRLVRLGVAPQLKRKYRRR